MLCEGALPIMSVAVRAFSHTLQASAAGAWGHATAATPPRKPILVVDLHAPLLTQAHHARDVLLLLILPCHATVDKQSCLCQGHLLHMLLDVQGNVSCIGQRHHPAMR